MPTVTFHMLNDEPIIEVWSDNATRSDLQRRAEHHGAIYYDDDSTGGEWDPCCQECGKKLRNHEDVGTYCPSGCRYF